MITTLKKEGKIEHLRNIICFDEVPEEKAKLASEVGVKTFTYNQILEIGKEHLSEVTF